MRRRRSQSEWFHLGIQLIVGVGMTVYAALWLLGSHPLGVIGPGIFGLSSLSNAYMGWRFGPGMDDRQIFLNVAWGVVAAGGIVAMWLIAENTDDSHYHESAAYFSFWLGLLVLLALMSAAAFLIPAWRNRVLRMRTERQDASREES